MLLLCRSPFTSLAVPTPPSQDLSVALRIRTAMRLSTSTGTAWPVRVPGLGVYDVVLIGSSRYIPRL